MFALLAVAALPLLTDVTTSRTSRELDVHVSVGQPLPRRGVKATLRPDAFVIEVPGVRVDPPAQTHGRARVSATATGAQVEVPIGPRLSCTGAVRFAVVPDGLHTYAACVESAAPTSPPVKTDAGEVRTLDAATGAQAKPEASAPAPGPAAAPAPKRPEAAPSPASALPVRPAPAALPQATEDRSPLDLPLVPAAVLLAVAALALALGRRKVQGARRSVQIVETASLGGKRALVVARVGGEALILATSESGVSLLASRPAAELDGQPAAAPPAPVPTPEEKLPSGFDALLAESAEDLALREKLARGLPGIVH